MKRTLSGSPRPGWGTSEYCFKSSRRRVLMTRAPKGTKGKRDRRRPTVRRRRPGGQSGPPEGFVGLIGHIAPGQPDVLKVTRGPVGELPAGPVALVPDVEGLADLVDQPWRMMICHRILGQSRHFQLLELS